jgi:type I restriction enzyme R subunit/putative DNA methylase
MSLADPRKTPFAPLKSRGELPHLYKEGGVYFVTFRLADAVDRDAAPIVIPEDATCEDIARAAEPPLRAGSCVLARRDIAELVQNALRHFEGQRYLLVAWCVMLNHVHAIFGPLAGHTPSQILQSWKGFTARRANQILGKSGPFWERESFDHLIRNERGLEWFTDYVHRNPVQAGLCDNAREWPYSSDGTGFTTRIFET